ncbi:MAG TPA: hypothetical protein VJ385_05880 [Fibrobacteria bacterium]|nr:hypothetical protein [Fibrobacteria bacterium]
MDELLSIADDIDVAEWGEGRIEALFGFLLHPLFDLFGKIVFEVPVQAIRFLDQENPAAWIPFLSAFGLEELHHVGKLGAPALLGGLHVGVLL